MNFELFNRMGDKTASLEPVWTFKTISKVILFSTEPFTHSTVHAFDLIVFPNLLELKRINN